MVLFRTAGVQDMYTVESLRFNAQCNANPKESSNIEHPEDFESAQQLPVFVWSPFPIVDTDFTAELQMRPGVLEDFANPLSIASKMFLPQFSWIGTFLHTFLGSGSHRQDRKPGIDGKTSARWRSGHH